MPTEAVLATLGALWRVLQHLQLPGALAGGLALSFWKHPRFTKDVDILVALGETETDDLVANLSAAGFRPKHTDPLVRLQNATFLQVLYEPAGEYIDVQVDLLLALNEYQRGALERRVPVHISELHLDIHVLSCEDLVLHKLLAGRIIDLADAAALLRANHASLDTAYLRRWVEEMRLETVLRQVWEEAFPDPANDE